jgi:hypothetical protein
MNDEHFFVKIPITVVKQSRSYVYIGEVQKQITIEVEADDEG